MFSNAKGMSSITFMKNIYVICLKCNIWLSVSHVRRSTDTSYDLEDDLNPIKLLTSCELG